MGRCKHLGLLKSSLSYTPHLSGASILLLDFITSLVPWSPQGVAAADSCWIRDTVLPFGCPLGSEIWSPEITMSVTSLFTDMAGNIPLYNIHNIPSIHNPIITAHDPNSQQHCESALRKLFPAQPWAAASLCVKWAPGNPPHQPPHLGSSDCSLSIPLLSMTQAVTTTSGLIGEHGNGFLPDNFSPSLGHMCVCVCVCVCVCALSCFHHAQLLATLWTVAHQTPLSMEFSMQEYWSGLPFPSPGIFLTQGSNPGLLHCRQILYHLSHQGSPSLPFTHC